MNVKGTVRKQYQDIVDQAAQHVKGLSIPAEGWLVTIRKALGMSGINQAKRLNVTRAAIDQAERAELEGGVTLKYMDKAAKAVGCKFVYAIVPETSIEGIIEEQAIRKATALVKKAGGHMALEMQSLTDNQTESEIKRLAEEFIREMPPKFWEDV